MYNNCIRTINNCTGVSRNSKKVLNKFLVCQADTAIRLKVLVFLLANGFQNHLLITHLTSLGKNSDQKQLGNYQLKKLIYFKPNGNRCELQNPTGYSCH